MENLFDPGIYDTVVAAMAVLAVVVFIALQRVEAAYGMTYSRRWGPSVGNKTGWIVMESPAFIVMALLWVSSPRAGWPAQCVMASLFMIHYFRRSFIFPLLMRGHNRMPWAIVLSGATFNVVNAYMLGGWLFHVSPPGTYDAAWLRSPLFLLGLAVFIAGMAVNIHSDRVIRNLRPKGDNGHYIPRKGLFRYVTGASYFGEFVEWTGYAILTWSLPGAVFALWTFANLAPRAKALHARYVQRFGKEYSSLNRHYIIPFIY